MLSTVIGILLAGQIAGLVVGILRNQNNKYKTDTENFEISAKSASLVLLGCSIVFFAFSFLSTFSVHESDSKVWIAFLVFAVPALLIALRLMRTICVRGSEIRVKGILPPENKKFDFSEITHYTASTDVTTVWSGKRKLFAYDVDALGAKNMTMKLKAAGIDRIEDDYGLGARCIRKKDVLSISKNSTIIALMVLMAICGLAFMFISGDYIITWLFWLPVMAVTFALLYIPGPVKNYLFIRDMEQALGIDFDAEMRLLNVQDYLFRDENWFGTSWSTWQLMIHRDYIQEIKKIYWDDDNHIETVAFRTIDGKKIKFKTGERDAFREWHEKHNDRKDLKTTSVQH